MNARRAITAFVCASVMVFAVAGITLVGPSGAAPTNGTGGTTLPSLSVNDVTVAEPQAGTVDATFVVSLSEASSQTVTVHFDAADGSATAPTDYRATSGTLTFAPGETSKTVVAKVKGDPVPEPAEVFYLQLSLPSNATISRPQGTATVVDELPTLFIGDTFIAEPDPGAINAALFLVTLSSPSSRTVTVRFVTADGSAVAGQDYEPKSGTLTFRPGEASKTISIQVRNDGISGPDKIFFLKLLNPSNAQLARAAGQATIVDADRIISISDSSILQPNPGTQTLAVFQVVLSEPTSGSTQPVAGFPTSHTATVDFTTTDGSAIAGRDYDPVSGTLVFPPGQSVRTISVPVRNNGVPGPDKTFYIRLSNPSYAKLARVLGQGTIFGSNRTIVIEDTSTTNANAPGNFATFVVSLAPTPEVVTVQYATADGTAIAGVDYGPQTGILTFLPGEASLTINVPIFSKTIDQNPDEPKTFYVDLFNPTNAVILRPRATGRIFDNYRLISVEDVTAMADQLTYVDATFTLSLSQPSNVPVQVDFATSDGTATSPADYQATSGTVTFPAGQTTVTVAVHLAPKPRTAPDKAFSLRLSGAANGKILRDQASATILTRGRGYWLVAADGGIFSFGDAAFFGSTGNLPLNQPIVGMAPTPSGKGYWLVAADGGIFSFGDAAFFGSTGNLPLNRPIVGMAPTPSGKGYWLVAADGGIFSFGDAAFFGSTGAERLTRPIVGIASSPSGKGYWLVASDGGIFAFGDVRFFGSTGSMKLSEPVAGMAATPSGAGYWLVTSDAVVFAFGDAAFARSETPGRNRPIVGIITTASGRGYWLVSDYGDVFNFGDARWFGAAGPLKLNEPIVGMARNPS